MGDAENKTLDWCLDDAWNDGILSQLLSSENDWYLDSPNDCSTTRQLPPSQCTSHADKACEDASCASLTGEELGQLLQEAGSCVMPRNQKDESLTDNFSNSNEEIPERITKLSLDDLDLSSRWRFQFANSGIYELSDFFGKSIDEIYRMPGIGKSAISEIEYKLKNKGLPSLTALCAHEAMLDALDDDAKVYIGTSFTFDDQCSKVRSIDSGHILGKPFDKCEYQEDLLTFLDVPEKDAEEIHRFCESNQIGWFSSIWDKFSKKARLVFGPEEPLETLLVSSIDHLAVDLGAAAFEEVALGLMSLFERKLNINLGLDGTFERVNDQCYPELRLVRVGWLSQVLFPDSRDNLSTIDNGLINRELNLLELYSIQKAIVAQSREISLYSQADSWQMLFAQAICDCLGSFKYKSAMTMYLPRLGVSVEGRRPTLEEVGRATGVTRERVRQVEKKMTDQVHFESARRLVPLRIALYSAVVELGGADKPERIAELLKKMKIKTSGLNIGNIVTLFPELSYDSSSKLVSLSATPCSSCDKANELCATILENDGCISSKDFHQQAGCLCCSFPIKPDLRLFDTIEGLRTTEDYLGTNTNPVIVSKLRPKSIRACIKATLFTFSRAFSIQELADIATKNTGKIAKKTAVNSLLSSMEDCSLWGRGTYIHNRHMPFPKGLLQQISDFCCTRFKDAKIPLVGVGGVYDIFSDQLEAEGIPNEQALYSLLRKYADRRLELREYPWICDKYLIFGRTTFAKYFYSVVEANNGFITDAHAQEIASKAMTQYWALDGLSQYSPFLIRANGGWFNIEAAGFDLDGIASLACEIANKMRDNDIVSCRKVFENHKERCYSYGVKSYDILYRLIDMMEDDLPLTASRIPHLIKTDKPTMGVKDAVRLYIRNSTTPVTYSEIVEEFGKRRGINTGGFCPALLLGKDIIETAQDTYWSIHNLKIDNEFMIRFDDSIKTLADSAYCQAGLFYSKSQTIPSFKHLPNIPGTRWTDTLLNAVFKRSKTFRAFGENGDCIVNIEQNPTIKDVETFYCALIENEFFGWTTFDKFADYCASHRIRSNLEPEFFDAFDSIEASTTSIECK